VSVTREGSSIAEPVGVVEQDDSARAQPGEGFVQTGLARSAIDDDDIEKPGNIVNRSHIVGKVEVSETQSTRRDTAAADSNRNVGCHDVNVRGDGVPDQVGPGNIGFDGEHFGASFPEPHRGRS